MEIVVTFPGNKKTSAMVDGFEVRTDQEPSKGGDGTAPSPFALFLASLASCSAVYIAFFCQKRGIPYDKIRVVQRDERDPETKDVRKISIDLELPPDFPGKYENALLHTVDLCTVKKTIMNPPEFELRAVRRE
ncbi:MAG: OsmC family protein [Candidatus Krumholzibacteria bacterium]|nr:OsmC family protein [Candidatus Krumholzibacteria bacterium]